MARTVDPDRHRRHRADIAAAVWRLVGRAGLEAVSLRAVAAEAGVSLGRVQHYFSSKDELLLFGLRLAQERMEARVRQRVQGDLLRAVVDELLGEDPDTRLAVRVWVAFLGRALEDARVAELLFADDAVLRDHTAEVIRAARPVSPEEAAREAHIVWSLANGLAAEVACGRTSAAEARLLLHHHLDRVVG